MTDDYEPDYEEEFAEEIDVGDKDEAEKHIDNGQKEVEEAPQTGSKKPPIPPLRKPPPSGYKKKKTRRSSINSLSPRSQTPHKALITAKSNAQINHSFSSTFHQSLLHFRAIRGHQQKPTTI